MLTIFTCLSFILHENQRKWHPVYLRQIETFSIRSKKKNKTFFSIMENHYKSDYIYNNTGHTPMVGIEPHVLYARVQYIYWKCMCIPTCVYDIFQNENPRYFLWAIRCEVMLYIWMYKDDSWWAVVKTLTLSWNMNKINTRRNTCINWLWLDVYWNWMSDKICISIYQCRCYPLQLTELCMNITVHYQFDTCVFTRVDFIHAKKMEEFKP